MDLVKLENGYVFGQSYWFFWFALNKSQVNIAACRILVAGILQATPVLQVPCIAQRPTGRKGLCLKDKDMEKENDNEDMDKGGVDYIYMYIRLLLL